MGMMMMMMVIHNVRKSLLVAPAEFVYVCERERELKRAHILTGVAATEMMYLLSCMLASCPLVSAEALLCEFPFGKQWQLLKICALALLVISTITCAVRDK